MAPNSKNNTYVAHPIYGADGFPTGWFKFKDKYLSPEVLYGSWPPLTTIKLGGRLLQVDRPSSVKITLLEETEDYRFWLTRSQHVERVNLGIYHRDFGDVEVAYSYSFPQTHIWFAGYSIHFETFESISASSYNATVHVGPENMINGVDKDQKDARNPQKIEIHRKGDKRQLADAIDSIIRNNGSDISPKNSKIYTVQVPCRVEALGLTDTNTFIDYAYTPQQFNDCERSIKIRDAYSAGVVVTSKSSPFNMPPVYPPLQPFQEPSLIYTTKQRVKQLTCGSKEPLYQLMPPLTEKRQNQLAQITNTSNDRSHVSKARKMIKNHPQYYSEGEDKNPYRVYAVETKPQQHHNWRKKKDKAEQRSSSYSPYKTYNNDQLYPSTDRSSDKYACRDEDQWEMSKKIMEQLARNPSDYYEKPQYTPSNSINNTEEPGKACYFMPAEGTPFQQKAQRSVCMPQQCLIDRNLPTKSKRKIKKPSNPHSSSATAMPAPVVSVCTAKKRSPRTALNSSFSRTTPMVAGSLQMAEENTSKIDNHTVMISPLSIPTTINVSSQQPVISVLKTPVPTWVAKATHYNSGAAETPNIIRRPITRGEYGIQGNNNLSVPPLGAV